MLKRAFPEDMSLPIYTRDFGLGRCQRKPHHHPPRFLAGLPLEQEIFGAPVQIAYTVRMATNKIKFSMSIEKINFTFEGDYEKGQAIQQGISNAVSGLAHLQSQAMGAEPPRKLIEGTVVDSKPSRRNRRRRSSTAAADGTQPAEGTNGDIDAEADAGGDSPRRSAGTGTSPLTRLVDLRKAGFFAEPRELGAILHELHNRGYSSIKGNDVSSPLMRLVQKEVLRRQKNPAGKWLYTAGVNEEPPK
jgi:hypothetical protein